MLFPMHRHHYALIEYKIPGDTKLQAVKNSNNCWYNNYSHIQLQYSFIIGYLSSGEQISSNLLKSDTSCIYMYEATNSSKSMMISEMRNLYNGFYEHQRKNHIFYSVQIPYTLARPQTRCTSMYPRVQLDFA